MISASKLTIKIDKKQLLKEIVANNARVTNQLVREYVEPRINALQEQMVEEFQSHPVTLEINSGPNASNTSGLLGGYGNLFSFIGFSSSDSPVETVIAILNKKITTSVKRRDNNGGYTITLIMPSKQEIYAATPIPWLSGRSWIDGIEKGLSGLGQYLYSEGGFKDSRSDTGIQVASRTSGVKFRNTPYLSKVIDNFKKKLIKI
jgi:hypothetical protein